MFSREIFADRLKQLRANAGLSCVALGNEVSVSAPYITQLEKGLRSPSVEILTSLAEFFNVSTDYLLCNDTQQPNTDPLFKQVQQLDLKQRSDVAQYIAFVLSKNQPKDDA